MAQSLNQTEQSVGIHSDLYAKISALFADPVDGGLDSEVMVSLGFNQYETRYYCNHCLQTVKDLSAKMP